MDTENINNNINSDSNDAGSIQQRISTTRRIIKSLKAKTDARRSNSERVADWMTSTFGSISFLLFNSVWFVTWIVLNIRLIPNLEPFDPFPFGLLTMIVSLEAIILAIFVLISQNRQSKVDDLREETDHQENIKTEQDPD